MTDKLEYMENGGHEERENSNFLHCISRKQEILLRLKFANTSLLERREKGETFTSTTASRARAHLARWSRRIYSRTWKRGWISQCERQAGSSNGIACGMKFLLFETSAADRLGTARRTETSLLAIRRWKLESRAHTDRPQEQPPLEWHERRMHCAHSLSLFFSFSVSPLPISLSLHFFSTLHLSISFRLFPFTPTAFINPEPTVHASDSDDTANICPPILRCSRVHWKREGCCPSQTLMTVMGIMSIYNKLNNFIYLI